MTDQSDDVVQSVDSQASLERAVSGTFVQSTEFHSSLPSTNDRGMALAKLTLSDDSHTELPTLILAAEQTAGRGRKGDVWLSPTGNLAFSLLLDIHELGFTRQDQARLSLIMAVAVCGAARRAVGDNRIVCKWPNDVLAGDRKIAGILVETTGSNRMVIGVGINVNSRQEDFSPEILATSLYHLKQAPVDAVSLLRESLGDFAQIAREVAGSSDLLPKFWREVDGFVDLMVGIRIAGANATGRVVGINRDGHLQLLTAEGAKSFPDGTIRLN